MRACSCRAVNFHALPMRFAITSAASLGSAVAVTRCATPTATSRPGSRSRSSVSTSAAVAVRSTSWRSSSSRLSRESCSRPSMSSAMWLAAPLIRRRIRPSARLVERFPVVLEEDLAESVQRAQRGAQVVGDRVGEAFDFPVGHLELRRPLVYAALEVGVRRATSSSAAFWPAMKRACCTFWYAEIRAVRPGGKGLGDARELGPGTSPGLLGTPQGTAVRLRRSLVRTPPPAPRSASRPGLGRSAQLAMWWPPSAMLVLRSRPSARHGWIIGPWASSRKSAASDSRQLILPCSVPRSCRSAACRSRSAW